MRTFTKGKRWTRLVSLFTAVLVIASLVAVAAPAPALAAHTTTVTLTPGGSKTSVDRNYTLRVENGSGSAIEKVVIDVPPAGTGGSMYNLTDKTDPSGWTCTPAADQFGTRTDTLTCQPTTLGVANALVESSNWTKGTDDATSAAALKTAIDGLDGVSATVATNVITVSADKFGAGGNDILLVTNKANAFALGGGLFANGAKGVKASATITVTHANIVANDSVTVTVPSAARIHSVGVKASGTFTVSDNSEVAGDSITIAGVALANPAKWQVGGSAAATATNIANAINDAANGVSGFVTATTNGATVIVESDSAGRSSNALSIATSDNVNLPASDTTLNGGVDKSLNFLFTATAPALAATYTWTVTSTDVGANGVLGTGNDDGTVTKNPTTTVENTAPTMLSVTTRETVSTNGKVDTAVVVFSESMDTTSFGGNGSPTLALWKIAGVEVEAVAFSQTTVANDTATFTITTGANEVSGTDVKDVTYAGTTVKDVAANTLAARGSGDTPAETDGAKPFPLTTTTKTTTTIEIAFSEPVSGQNAGHFAVAGQGQTVTGAAVGTGSNTHKVTLTVGTALATDAVPAVTYTAGTLTDGTNTVANFTTGQGSVTATADGVAPTFNSGVTTSTTNVRLTFSEVVASVTAANFTVAGTTVTGATLVQNDNTKVDLTLGTALASNATPSVTYTQGTLKDADDNLVVTTTVTAADTVAPKLQSITWTDVDSSGTINAADTLALQFDEPILQSTVDATNIDTRLSVVDQNGNVTANKTYGQTPTLTWTTTSKLTVTLGTPEQGKALPVALERVNPSNDIKDASPAANVDATANPAPQIVQVTLSLSVTATRGGNSVALDALRTGDSVTVAVNISAVQNFDAAGYTLNWTQPTLTFVSAAQGSVGGTVIPVSGTSPTTPTALVTVSQNVPGTAGVNGSGTLATLTFTFAGKSGGTASTLSLSDVSLSNAAANTISANLAPDVNISSPLLRGDADGNGVLNVLDITKVEQVVAGAAAATSYSLKGANADASGTDILADINALDITKTEILVAAAP